MAKEPVEKLRVEFERALGTSPSGPVKVLILNRSTSSSDSRRDEGRWTEVYFVIGLKVRSSGGSRSHFPCEAGQ